MYDLRHITKLDKINKHSLACLGKAVENKNRNTNMEYLQLWFGTKFWDLFEEFVANFWELKRERERESSGTLLGISGTSAENLFGWEQN